LIVVLALVVPAIAMWLESRVKAARALGPVVLCYAFGIALGNVLHVDGPLTMHVCEGTVALAIPLLLFTSDLARFRKLAPSMTLAFIAACVAAMVAAALIGYGFRHTHDDWWKIAGMLVGVYIGGSANMNAIGLALDAKHETFVLVNAADAFIGALYLLFLLTVARRMLLWFMKPNASVATVQVQAEKIDLFGAAPALGLSLLLVSASAAVSFAFTQKLDATVLLVCLTTFALAASAQPSVRSWVGGRVIAYYLLLSFCVAIGSLARVDALLSASGTVLAFVSAVMLGSIVLHVALCALFRIDADTTILSSTATIFGPAFVLPVARANDQGALLGPALTLAVMGLAIGTYCGLAVAHTLRLLTGAL